MSETTKHYSSAEVTSAEEEESYQAEEYDAFFNSEEEPSEEEISAYTLTDGDAAALSEQIGLTNELLGTVIALLMIFAIFCLMRFIYRLLLDNIFKYL